MAGEAECQFNTNCWIRGRMVGMTGTFTGTFKADEVNVVSSLNIRNGSVSSYIQFSRKRDPVTEDKIRSLEWVIDAQPYASVIDITVPIHLRMLCSWFQSHSPMTVYVKIYRNDQLVASSGITDYVIEFDDFAQGFNQMSSIRYIDFDVPADTSVKYKVVVENDPNNNFTGVYPNENNNHKGGGSSYEIWTRGKAMTAIRKR